MSGNGNLACCCAMRRIRKLYPEINGIEETMNRYPTLLKGWVSIGMEECC